LPDRRILGIELVFNSSLLTYLKGLLHDIFPLVHDGLFILTRAVVSMQLLIFLKDDAVLFFFCPKIVVLML
jgi:hypothetical protein